MHGGWKQEHARATVGVRQVNRRGLGVNLQLLGLWWASSKSRLKPQVQMQRDAGEERRETSRASREVEQNGEKRARVRYMRTGRRKARLCSPKTERHEIDSRDPESKSEEIQKGAPKWEETKRSWQSKNIKGERGVELESIEREMKRIKRTGKTGETTIEGRGFAQFADLRDERSERRGRRRNDDASKNAKILQNAAKMLQKKEGRMCEAKDGSVPSTKERHGSISQNKHDTKTGRRSRELSRKLGAEKKVQKKVPEKEGKRNF